MALSFRSWLALSNGTIRSKIGSVNEKVLKINFKLVFGADIAPKGSPVGKIVTIGTSMKFDVDYVDSRHRL